jgi:plastocyanin
MLEADVVKDPPAARRAWRRWALGLGGLALPAVAAALLWSAGDARAQGSRNAVTIVDFEFQPPELTVALNTRVTWTNRGDHSHTVTDRGGTFDTRPIAPNSSGSITFTAPGRYDYFCRINPSRMNGVIVVRPGAQPANANRIQAVDDAREGERLRFDPSRLTVQTGSALVVANIGGAPHTLTADNGSFDTGIISPGPEGGRFAGSNAVIRPTKPGSFKFHCEVHPQVMRGTLTVTGKEVADGGEASDAPRQANVTMQDFAFDKPEVSVAPGGQVTWRNEGGALHTATFDDVKLESVKERFDTKRVQPGAQASLKAPEEPGSYTYRCTIHPDRMRGVLVVLGQNVADPTRVGTEQAAARASPAGGAGGNRGTSLFALLAGVLGAFFGGFGISAFVRNRMGAS